MYRRFDSCADGHRRRDAVRRLLVAIGLVALIVPATVGAASPNNWTDSAFFEYGNANCGGHIEGAPLLGSVEFTRSGGHMTLRVELDGAPATADTDYILSLWNATDCTKIGGDIATLTTNGFAVATATFEGIRLKGAKSVFAALWNDDLGIWNDSTIVP